MNALLLSLRCLLSAVFLVAAVGKLLDLPGSRKALKEFGVPEPLVRVGAVALPGFELCVALALLLQPSAVWGALGGLILLLAFVGGVARAMTQGRAPDCHCFGQIHSEPAGVSTLVRNALLAAAAVVVVAGGSGPSLDGALEGLSGTQVALVVVSTVAALLAIAVWQLWSDRRRLGRELAAAIAAKAPAGLPRGMPAPDIGLSPVRGRVESLAELMTPGRPTVLVFVSTNCSPCLQMLPALARWQGTLIESVSLPAIFAGERTDIERVCDEHDLALALAQEDNEAFGLYNLRATPSAVLISGDGVVASAPAEGVPAIEALIRTSIAPPRPDRLVVHRG